MRLPAILACPSCALGRPEIIGRQDHGAGVDADGDGSVHFRVQCPTCGYGRTGAPFPDPEVAVDAWNATVARYPETAEKPAGEVDPAFAAAEDALEGMT